MLEHIDDNSVPKNIPVFAKNMFTDTSNVVPTRIGDQSSAKTSSETKTTNATKLMEHPTTPGKQKRKSEDDDGRDKKKGRKKGNNKAFEKGLFFLKDNTLPVSKIVPPKEVLSKGLCLDFCSHGKACKRPTAVCKFAHYLKWTDIPAEDKTALINHMDKTGSLWLDSEAIDASEFPSEFAYLLGNASGPKQKSA